MRINISYHQSLSFEQFKEQFEQHFALANPIKKEAEMKKVWEKAEQGVKPKAAATSTNSIVAEESAIIDEAVVAEDSSNSKRRKYTN